ncbi:MAG: hypothetical protein BWK79_19620, partial [Beggiatoa sp. IS2]
MKIIALLILSLGLSANTLATVDPWQTGEDFFQTGDMLLAIQQWEQALSNAPPSQAEHIDKLIHLAVAYQTQANYLQAKTTLQ